MKQLRIPAVILALLAVQACSSSQPTEQAITPVNATLDNPATVVVQSFIMRGEVVIGPEVRSFTPCGSNQQYWLELPPELSVPAQKLNQSPYQILYGEMIGYLVPPSQTGFNADYLARFVVQQINQLSAENTQRCQHPTNPTRAFGTEPFWSVQFSAQGLEFQPLGSDKQLLTIQSSQLSASRRIYQFEQGALTLEQTTCTDSMSDNLYSWRSTLTLKGETYQGCAVLSNLDTTQEWVGTYFASATEQQGFGVTLELNPDHSATTRYRYLNGERELVEKGFWQQLNPDQIQVVMTLHQQQYLLSERVFSRRGYQLHADKEKIGNVVYPIRNGGLILFQAKPISPRPSTEKPPLDQTVHNIPSRDEYDEEVDQAVRRYFALHKTDPAQIHYRWLKYDLNGNQHPELLVQLDWCQHTQCTLLIFEQKHGEWHFNSRINGVQTPFRLGKRSQYGWQDLMLPISTKQTITIHQLQYNGISYPVTSKKSKTAHASDISGVSLFSDGLSPRTGVKL
ncbi:COG3650 family protein [Vibrio sp.]|uniref:COG3650 family protein n=1 Tax=Vibrio sp. TaxID=678 RepID=UPI003D14A505